MTAQFAGSRNLGDRRRRRLAQQAGGDSPRASAGRINRERRAASTLAATEPLPELPLQLPRDTIIPRSPWRLAGIAFLGICLWLTVLILGLMKDVPDAQVRELVQLQGGPLLRFFSTVALLLASQLSFLIYYYRSRSRKDFMGRYRIWVWAGTFWGLACLFLATGIHHPIAKTLSLQWPLPYWRSEVSYWMAPFGVGLLAVYQMVACDVRQCRISRLAWGLAFVLALAAGGLHLGLEILLPMEYRVAVVAGVTTFWHLFLVITLLIHARFVAHVTNEAGPRSFSVWSLAGRWFGRHVMEFGEWVISLLPTLITAVRPAKVTKPSNLPHVTVAAKSKGKKGEASKMPKQSAAEARKNLKADVATPELAPADHSIDNADFKQQVTRRWWNLRGWNRNSPAKTNESLGGKKSATKITQGSAPPASDAVPAREINASSSKPTGQVKSSGSLGKKPAVSASGSMRIDQAAPKISRIPTPHLGRSLTEKAQPAQNHQQFVEDDDGEGAQGDDASGQTRLSKKERKRLKQLQRESRQNR
jgi:hypothetical protein